MLNQPKSIYLAALSSNYWCYDFDAQVLIFLNFWIIFFVILFVFEILTYYPNIDDCIGLEMKHNLAYLSVSVEAIDFNDVNTTSFLKQFVVLREFFMIVDLLESN